MPSACRRCGQALHGEDPHPRKHQVAEIPPVEAEVTEYRLHRAHLRRHVGRGETRWYARWRGVLSAKCIGCGSILVAYEDVYDEHGNIDADYQFDVAELYWKLDKPDSGI
jgi:hypothetical protein